MDSNCVKYLLYNVIITKMPFHNFLLFLLYLFFVPTNTFGQREKVFRQFPKSYFDSIRVLINDTSKEYYTIKAYRMSRADEVFIDSYHDHRTGYKFVVSPTGVRGDELRYDDIKRDGNWNGIWYSEGTVDEKGWYAEIKIPFFNFRYPRDEIQILGFNMMRNISKNASRGQWKPHLPEWDNTTRMSWSYFTAAGLGQKVIFSGE